MVPPVAEKMSLGRADRSSGVARRWTSSASIVPVDGHGIERLPAAPGTPGKTDGGDPAKSRRDDAEEPTHRALKRFAADQEVNNLQVLNDLLGKCW